MKRFAITVAVTLIGLNAALADTCSSKAMDKNGKPLGGAAKTSFMDKCKKDSEATCEAKAMDKNGKPLAGAAKSANMKKCMDDSMGAM